MLTKNRLEAGAKFEYELRLLAGFDAIINEM